MGHFTKIIMGLLLFSISFGCKSKFSETSPEKVAVKGLPLQERVAQKEKIDSKINEIQDFADRIKKLLDLFRKVQAPEAYYNVYTPFDFLLDVSAELKKQFPEKQYDRILQKTIFKIPGDLVSEECRKIEVKLESSIVYGDGQEKVGEKVIYSVHTCKMKLDEFQDVFEASWINSNLTFQFYNKTISEVLGNDLIAEEKIIPTNCEILKNQAKQIVQLSCKQLYLRISKSEHTIAKIDFSDTAEVRFMALVDVFENAFLKAKIKIWQIQGKNVEYEIQKQDGLKPN